jgi:predicted N-acetyltransferase YhbS
MVTTLIGLHKSRNITVMSSVQYRSNIKITEEQFIDLLKRSTLDQRRPIHDLERIRKMLHFGNILITAWQGDLLVGASRALSDFSFCCYLSDLAVDEKFQHQGIGKELVRLTHEVSGMETTLILLAAPAAETYYPKINMEKFEHCFVIKRKIN